MSASAADQRWMAAAVALSARGRGQTAPNPNVGCIIVGEGRVIARGWTQPGGRPHAEAMALAAAGDAARGATAYVTLEPCAHQSARGAACADSLIAAGVARVVLATRDPDPRTNGGGIARLSGAGISITEDVLGNDARAAMAGWWTRTTASRAHVTLKLATSLDGCIAMAVGESRWITGDAARRHAHLLRAQSDAILVGRGTWEADAPALDVRLPGLAGRAPRRLLLSSRAAAGIEQVASPQAAATQPSINDLLVEGGAATAAAFLRANLVDRLILYRAPILIGGGQPCLADIGLTSLADAHGQWRLDDARQLGNDRMEVYARVRGD
jgi:diaminohydroxyphosphoribosylaminopyrimidine deaminase / 5-amino-6-(5-phosphoribosylamino)uracil reductase